MGDFLSYIENDILCVLIRIAFKGVEPLKFYSTVCHMIALSKQTVVTQVISAN